jgi:hypothetical protein
MRHILPIGFPAQIHGPTGHFLEREMVEGNLWCAFSADMPAIATIITTILTTIITTNISGE